MSDHIPIDAYREVLRRLPVEKLFQLRSVCKTWRGIIDDPGFSKLHINGGIGDGWVVQRNNTGNIFLLQLRHLIFHQHIYSECGCDYANMESCCNCNIEWVYSTNVKYPVGPGLPRMLKLPVPCCNGLILISSIKPNIVWVIWNPFTGESVKLPLCDDFPKNVKTGTALRNPYSGIGYDEVNDDYKVVRIVEPCTTFVCSVNSRAWRKIEDFPHDFTGPHTCFGAYAHGALHWIASTPEKQGWIVALDLATETYRKMPLPQEIASELVRNPGFFKLVELSGCLFLIWWDLSGRFGVWMIGDYYNGCNEKMWTKMMSSEEVGVDSSQLTTPIAYLKNENRVLFWHENEKFSWYDVKDKLLGEVYTKVINPGVFYYIDGPFTSQVIPASLVRLNKSDNTKEDVALQGKSSKRKRKRVAEPETLGLKVLYGSPDDWC